VRFSEISAGTGAQTLQENHVDGDSDVAVTSRIKSGPREHGGRQHHDASKRSSRSRLGSGVSRPRTVRLPLSRETDKQNAVGADFSEPDRDRDPYSNQGVRIPVHRDNPLVSQVQVSSGLNMVRFIAVDLDKQRLNLHYAICW
jgi:hypothetical protein